MNKFLLYCLAILFSSTWALAEGSRTLAPNYDGTGSLVAPSAANRLAWLEHDGPGGFSGNFLSPTAPANERMYIRIRPGETLHYGIRRIAVRYNNTGAYSTATIEGNNQDLSVILYDNNGNIVQATFFDTDVNSDGDATLTTSYTSSGSGTAGIISSVAASKLGPQFTYGSNTVNAGGYAPLSYTNNTGVDQDFYVAFLQDDYTYTSHANFLTALANNTIADVNIRSWYDLWDFSVYDGNEEKPGRLHCKRWNLNVQDILNVLADEVQFYALVPSFINGVEVGNYVKRIDLGGLAAFSVIIYANSQGSNGTGGDENGDGNTDFQDYRMSTDSDIGEIEYDMFINNPDINLYPTTVLPTISITDANVFCGSTGNGEAVVQFETNQTGQIAMLIDLNGLPGFQEGSDDVIIEAEITTIGKQSLRWNGLDGGGTPVPSGTDIVISGRFTSAPIHVPLYDVESNSEGMNMLDVRPATSFNLIYWDDTNIAADAGSSSAMELDGTNTSLHTWTNGGDTGDEYLINTWSFGYYQINTQNITFTYSCDPDGDGISGSADADSDNDGVADAVEGNFLGDNDGDGIPNYLDEDIAGFVDSNGDGVNDNYDADLDGIPNAIDLDSDNDGIPDLVENGLADANNDGMVDSFTDANGNGLNDANDPACDGVPIPATVYATIATTGGAQNPNNALGAPDGNYANLDATNDFVTVQFGQTIPSGSVVTINMALQTGSGFNVTFFQSADGTNFTNQTQIPLNGGTTPTDYTYTVNANATHIRVRSDGTTQRFLYHLSFLGTVANPCSGGTTLTPPDRDADGIPNYLDLDSDNDGLVDTWEAGGTAGANGQINGFTDTDGNGRNDQQEIVALSLPDTDSDGLRDYLDIDADNDGIVDNYEAQSSASYLAIAAGDANGNGLLEVYDPTAGGTLLTPVDTDADGTYDFRDSDADGDGVADFVEGWDADFDGFSDLDADNDRTITDETGYGTDTDGDGLRNIFDNNSGTGIANIIGSSAPRQNTDGADLRDWQDTDDDNDGSLTSGEDVNNNGNWTDDKTQGQGGSATVPDYLYRGDYDGDNIYDKFDADSDNDGIKDTDEANGEAIDPSGDDDNDGVPNYRDADIGGSLSSASDTNGDGVFDVYDSDMDGVPDFLDLDSDNDGIWDAIEANAGSIPNGLDQTTGRFTLNDPDNDGLMNFVDSSPATGSGNSTLSNPDTDGDGTKDYLDIDSDNDGILDIIEAQTTASYVALSGLDSDGDGIDDAFDPSNGGSLIEPVNTDGLDLQDYRDTDTDNDNIPDLTEGNDNNRDGNPDAALTGNDTDGDGLDDAFDTDNGGSLPVLQNTDAVDDKDWRDTDDDNDGILTINEDANDNGDYTDDNTNGQGISLIPDYLFNGDFDGDGISDFIDLDDDNDGILDSEEGYTNVVLINGSFESPVIPATSFQLQDETNVPGWNTTAGDNQIEIWSNNFNGVPAYEGNQFAEINANLDAQLYQDVATEPGTLIYWTIAHRGRSGTDEFRILIGPTSGPVDNGTFATSNAAWAVYSGYYLVPAGQTTTRFGFESVSTSTGSPSVGNLIDNFALFATQNGGDSDGDGLPDYLDRDSNNNGIPDLKEAGGTDTDGDGEVDSFTDTDADGLHDPYDADNGGTSLISGDVDGDGILDVLDLDSDNDGIPDIIEAGGTDANGDGRLDDLTDTDKDGLADIVDPDNGGTPLATFDTDYDRLPDFLDLDSDNDGITDAFENGGTDSNFDGFIDGYENDTDGDGLADVVDPDNGGSPIANVDTDNDGLSDYRDLDSDNDGMPDIREAGGTDTDHDGRVDAMLDSDQDGIPNSVDVTQTGGADVDGDGIRDTYDVTYTGGNDDDGDGIDNIYDPDRDGDGLNDYIESNPYAMKDSDGDGNRDFRDLDSDNDGIVDVIEFGLSANAATGTIAGFTDTDNDGFNDTQDGYLGTNVNGSVAPITAPNTDLASEPATAIVPNYLDIDSDNDGIVDLYEAQTKATLITLSGNDVNDNGLDDAFDPTAGGTFITPVNTDGTGSADYLDDDSDADGFNDRLEGNNGNKDRWADWDVDQDNNFDDAGYNTDNDEDGLLDIFDNVASIGQLNVTGSSSAVQDTDRDGTWDFQDVDDDNDGINTGVGDGNTFNDDPDDIIPDYLFGDADIDDDGVNNEDDLDSDNDGASNAEEDGGTGIDPSLDNDNDGLLNYEDPDIDGDGTQNGADTNTNGTNTTSFTDTNNDGVIDQFDRDLDGRPDYIDLDSDNDGIADILEFNAGLTDTNEDGRVDGFTDANGNGLNDAQDPACDGSTINTPSTGGTNAGTSGTLNNIANILDSDNTTFGTFNSGAYITVELNGSVLVGNNIVVRHRRNGGGGTSTTIVIRQYDSGFNLINSTGNITSDGTERNQTYTVVTSNARYIRIENTGANTGRILHISYTYTTPICSVTGTAITPADTDGDGLANYLDLDSDQDGIPDNIEAQAEGAYRAPLWVDSDGDGIMNIYDENTAVGNALAPVNTDGADNPDYLDTDSDNDGVLDVVEGWDGDGDGYADWDTDNDNDPADEGGYSSDTDQDGISYLFDTVDGRGPMTNITGTGATLQDTDGDNTRDFRDTDDDNDGINTSGENSNSNGTWADDFTQGGVNIPNYLFNPDFDGDGIANSIDPDADGDGIPSSVEFAGITYTDNSTPFGDDDGDGIFNYLDADANGFVDTNNDGVDDRVDRDRDGIPNFLDLDSDDDGILDVTEASFTNYALGSTISASSINGTYGSPLAVVIDDNTNGNGEATSNHTNSDNEAWVQLDLGQVRDISTVNVWNRTDCCTDRADNFYVFVSETPFSSTSLAATLVQSGVTAILQNREAASPSVFNFNTTARYIRVQLTETNFLHLAELQVFSQAQNNDTDALPNYLDIDSDNDGITDNREAQNTTPFITITAADTDRDGIKDVFDANNGGTTLTPIDTDSDGTPDYLDTDSDGDNVADVIEGFDANKNGFSDLDIDQDFSLTDETGYGVDTDGDGLENIFDNFSGSGITNINGSRASRQDTDIDGTPDWRDDEDDSDGIQTTNEDTSNGAGGGADGLYYNDKTQGGGATPDYLYFNDIDDDGIADGIDLDSDNDGITDAVEANGTTYTGASGPFDDDDNDGLFNYLDDDATGFVDSNGNGIDDRVDADGDGIPNFFDLDSDGDGIPDGVEGNGGTLPAGQNSNGQFPPSAADADDDGIADNVDAGSTSTLPIPDTDGDGLPDYLDLDSDSDGITDLVEAGGNDFNGDGKLDSSGDTDGDGLGNIVDTGNGGTPLPYRNTDGTGGPDYRDTDSEDDGLPDLEEGFFEAGPLDYIQSYINRVTAYNSANGATSNTLYNTNDTGPANGRPDYLDDADGDGIPNILDPQSAYFLDDDGDGLVNVFDPDQLGNFYGNVNGEPDRDDDGIPNILDTNDIPLPLDFLEFKGEEVYGKVKLLWKTTNEVNVSHFIVEHSFTGSDFRQVGTLDAFNEKDRINNYQFLHEHAELGYNFYRVTEVDFDGYRESTNIILVSVSSERITWVLFPNPVEHILNVGANITIPDGLIRVTDASGRVIFERQASFGTGSFQIDASQWASGLYHLVIELPDGKETFRILKK